MPPGMNTVVADPTKADQVLAEVIPGILEWSGRHPNHGSIVHSHYLTEQRVAIDPIGIDGIVAALERAGGVRKRAAELLGIKYRSLRHRLSKYGLASGDDDELDLGPSHLN